MDTAIFGSTEFVCVRQDGRVKTNFPQVVWLDNGLAWNQCANDSDLLDAISINILQHLFSGVEEAMSDATCSLYARTLYPAFVSEILSSMPENGGNLPVDVVRDWARERLSEAFIPELNQCAS